MANENKKATFKEKVKKIVNSEGFETTCNIIYGVGAVVIIATWGIAGCRAIKNKAVNDFLN